MDGAGSDDGDDGSDVHPDISASEDEDDLEVDLKHSKLLEAIGSMEPKKKSKVKQRSEPSAEVSEFQLNTKDVQGKGVWIHDLMGSLRDTPTHAALKKQMNTVNKRKVLPTPLHQHETEKIQRTMAYAGVSKEVSKWDQVVQANRRAEHLSFPLKQEVLGLPTTDQFVRKFKPSTPLEQEVYKILHGSKFAERPNKKLSQTEEEALKAMSLSEAQERRAELQKHRALMSFYEAKCRRQKKIKSKKYHRIQRKTKERKDSKIMEELMKNDPEGAQQSLDKIEKDRATERMSLKHRNTGKWAKTMIRYGKHNISARHEIAQQLQKSHELTEKIAEVNQDDKPMEDVLHEDDEEQGEGAVQPSLSDINNPWFSGRKAGGGKDGEEEEKEEEEREKGGYVALEEVRAAGDDGGSEEEEGKEEEGGDDDELEEDHKMLKMIQEERRKWKDDSRDNESDEEEEEEDEQAIAEFAKELAKKRKAGNQTADKEKTKKTKRGQRKVIEVKDLEEINQDEIEEESLLEEGTERRQTQDSLEDQDWLNRIEEEGVKSQSTLSNAARINSHVEKENTSTKGSSGIVDPNKVLTMRSTSIKTTSPLIVEEEDDDGEGNERHQHQMNIQQAFADDDVVDEFKEEKKTKVEKDKPKHLDLTLPGWGDWGGVGAKTSKRKKKRFVIKAGPQAPRRDSHLPHVIINENRNKKIAIHQVNNLPFPFSSSEQFERSIRSPIGSTWNTPSAVKALTTPKVTTKMGTVIEPIQAEEAFKGKRKKPKQQDQGKGKRRGPRPDIVFGGGDDGQKKGTKTKRRGKGKGK